MLISIVVRLFTGSLGKAVAVIQERVDNYRDPRTGGAALKLVDITADYVDDKNEPWTKGCPLQVVATVKAATATNHAEAALAATSAVNPLPLEKDPVAATLVKVTVRDKK